MKRIVSLLSLTCIILGIASVAGVSVSAADELTINGKAKAKVDDKVTYTLYLADADDEIVGFDILMNFDNTRLKTDVDSIDFGGIDNVVKNVVDNEIYLNFSNLFNKLNFSQKKPFLTIEFTVINGGEADISQFVREMYGEDMTYLKSFTWTYDLKINDKTVISSKPPIVINDTKLVEQYQGAIINYADGKGDNNGGGDNREAVTAANNELLKNRNESPENMVGQTVTVDKIITDIQDVTRYRDADQEGGGGLPMPLIIGIGVVVFGGLIVAAIVISKKKQS